MSAPQLSLLADLAVPDGEEARTYAKRIDSLLDASVAEIKASLAAPVPAFRPPSSPDSKFEQRRAFSDWAEGSLSEAVNRLGRDYQAIRYGRDERALPGEPGAREHFQAVHEELWRGIGKRPDLLLGCDPNPDRPQGCDAAFEVKASQPSYAARKREEGSGFNFTVKVEELRVFQRFIQKTGLPLFFVQVFLDEVHLLPLEELLERVTHPAKLGGYKIERHTGNQGKATIYLPLSEGKQIGFIDAEPEKEVVTLLRSNGQPLDYVGYSAGRITLNPAVLDQLLLDARKR